MTAIRDLTHRIPVWKALSEFYLDTELSEKDYQRIAETLKVSPYSFEEILEIDLYEVFPVLQMNLLSSAGAWAGFDHEWLIEKCKQQLKHRKSSIRRLMYRFLNSIFYRMRKEHFEKVKAYFNS